jgi:hypothetical protein
MKLSPEAINATNEIKELLLRESEPHPDEILAIVQTAIEEATKWQAGEILKLEEIVHQLRFESTNYAELG